MRILLACDRSGGHIFPAMALGKKIRECRQDDVCFFAPSSFLREHLEREGFCVFGRCFHFRNLVLESFYRFIEALYLLICLRPKRIIGFGGRESFFLILFGSLFGLDAWIYEPNVKPGRANRVLSIFAKRILCGFENVFLNNKTEIVGIPLRENLKKIDRNEALRALGFEELPVIFCFGGSQGSSFINNACMRFAQESEYKFQVIHLTGKREYFQIAQFYNKMERKSYVRAFSDSMEILYSASDIVISRAGASSLGEISYYHIPSILIPYPEAGGHQKDNAFYFSRLGAAFTFLQEEFAFEDFKTKVEFLLADSCARADVSANLEKIKLAAHVGDFCQSVFSSPRPGVKYPCP